MVEHVKGIQMPPHRKRGPRSIYRWYDMSVGDCFQFPTHVAHGDARRMAYEAGRVYCMKFTVRVLDDGTCWCWRVADGYRGETRDPNKATVVQLQTKEFDPKPRAGDVTVGIDTPHPDGPSHEEPPEDEI